MKPRDGGAVRGAGGEASAVDMRSRSKSGMAFVSPTTRSGVVPDPVDD